MAENQIVSAMAREVIRQATTEIARLEIEPPGRRRFAMTVGSRRGDRQAGVDLFLGDAANHVVEEAARLAGVARGFRHAFLVGVQLFEHDHGQENVVLFKAENCGRVVHQHIGVENEQSPGARFHRDLAASNTSAAWPSILTLRHSRRSLPVASRRNVLRTMPRTLRPYMFLS